MDSLTLNASNKLTIYDMITNFEEWWNVKLPAQLRKLQAEAKILFNSYITHADKRQAMKETACSRYEDKGEDCGKQRLIDERGVEEKTSIFHAIFAWIGSLFDKDE